ncbi:MAG: cytochrome c biogenesis protein CcsA [Acidobacteria bacterium]|nr:cytochrome c biogenesis protein CcsA [Acidobacteriota bacterium]
MYYPGSILLWAALLFGIASTVAYVLSLREDRWRTTAHQAYVLMTVAVIAASGLLMYLLLTHDYRLSYVTAYSDNSLSWQYLVSSFWAGQEGSFLLWVFFASLLGLPLMRYARHYESRAMIFYNLTVLSLIMLLVKQDPFHFHPGLTAARIPLDGAGLNPLLQNPWMVIHPPVMFIGYAAMAVPFAFAMAALWMRRYDEWTKASMPWVLLALVTLGAAIMLGAYWSYETLGWGGYWGWDPVENASLVPWLMTAALTHGLVLQRARKRFRRLNIVLAVLGFLFVVYGTFLTRSGVLANFSVHSFVNLGITAWLVFNLAFFLIISVGLLALRWKEIPAESGEEPFWSLTIISVIGILLLLATGLFVAVGTSAPLITELFTKPAQVGPSFYNRVGLPLAMALALILGIIPFLTWKGPMRQAGRRLAVVLGITALLTALAAVLGARQPLYLAYVAVAFFAIVANASKLIRGVRHGSWKEVGGPLTHIGVGIMLLSFLVSGVYSQRVKLRLVEGHPTKVLGYTLTFKGVEQSTPESHNAMVVDVTAPKGKSYVLKPHMWINRKTNQLVAKPDIKKSIMGDLYLAPAQYDPGEEAPVSGTLRLAKDRPVAFRSWHVVFKGFDLSRQNAVPNAITVGAVVEIDRPGEKPVKVEPSIISTNKGVQAVPVTIPGTGAGKIRLSGMDANSGVIRVQLLGLGGGIARKALLRVGQSLKYDGVTATFEGFDLSDFKPEAGRIHIGVKLKVTREGKTYALEPKYLKDTASSERVIPAGIPGSGGLALTLGKIDANGGAVELELYDPSLPPQPPARPSLVLDVSTKPGISLVWIGTIILILGIFLAMVYRRRDIASIPLRDD